MADPLPAIKDMDEAALQTQFSAWGERPFRLKQLREWLYGEHFALGFDEMANLPAALRERLAQTWRAFSLEVLQTLTDPDDGTVKWLCGLADGQTIETVLIRVPGRTTVCISTQVGCAVRCVFCASGRHGLVRNLTKAEILDQLVLVSRHLGRRVDNVVVMGMGEPLMNLENLTAALDEAAREDTLNLGARHVTISTSGIVPGIRSLAQTGRCWNLALSLHAVTDEERRLVIPDANRYPLEEIFEACAYHRQMTGRMLTLEYALIAGKNDSDAQLAQLAAIARRMRAKVNLIPCNPAGAALKAPTVAACRRCLQQLLERGVQATLRLSHGKSISAACGQLRQRFLEQPSSDGPNQIDPNQIEGKNT